MAWKKGMDQEHQGAEEGPVEEEDREERGPMEGGRGGG